MSTSPKSLKARLDAVHAKRARGEGGFTLIELLVVVVIIGILVAIAIPLYLNYRTGAQNKATESDVRGSVSAVEQCFTDNNNKYPVVADVTGGTAGAPLGFKCNGVADAQKAPMSGDTKTMTYALVGTNGYSITGESNGGKSYKYDSTTGKLGEVTAPATP